MRQPTNEIESLTSIRGLAAGWVAAFHFWPSVVLLFPRAALLDPFMSCGYLAVPMFFVLSGYVISLRYLNEMREPRTGSILKFFFLRLARVYPVHAATLIVAIGMNCRHGWPNDDAHSPQNLIRNVTLTHAWDRHFHVSWNYPSWSISSEWFAYLLFPFVAMALTRLSRRAVHGLIVVSVAAGAAVYHEGQDLPWFGVAAVTPCFIGGAALAHVWSPGDPPPAIRRLSTLLILAAVVVPFLVPAAARPPLLVAAFFVLVGMLGRAGHHGPAFLRTARIIWIGEISYSLYMTHATVITLATRFIPISSSSSSPAKAAWCMGVGIAMAVAGTATYHLVEKPARTSIRRWFTKPLAGAVPTS